MYKLIEFKNKGGDTLRGIATLAKSDTIALCLHGFERTAVTEKKFKVLADELLKKNISSFRFDFTGTGLSDGDFKHTTVASMADDLARAMHAISEYGKSMHIVAHSLGACVAAKYSHDNSVSFRSIVLLGPALNQKELMRFWFALSSMKKNNPSVKITWDNYQGHLDEPAFSVDCARQDKMMKANYISADYFLENKEEDYGRAFVGMENVLHIHGDSDDKVPLQSITAHFSHRVIVNGGDHDCERPDMREQWIEKVAAFIAERGE